MKRFLLFVIIFLLNLILVAQNAGNEAAQIKQQMAAIRRSTNWGDPAAAKEANAKIEALAVKLTQALRQNNSTQEPAQGINGNQSKAKVENEIQQKMDATVLN